jgi:hypothetical protein
MLLGPMLLLLLVIHILEAGTGWMTLADGLYFAVLVIMILGRWVELRSGQAQTATGEAATAAHFYRYAAGVLILGLAAWIVANFLGNHWMAR